MINPSLPNPPEESNVDLEEDTRDYKEAYYADVYNQGWDIPHWNEG